MKFHDLKCYIMLSFLHFRDFSLSLSFLPSFLPLFLSLSLSLFPSFLPLFLSPFPSLSLSFSSHQLFSQTTFFETFLFTDASFLLRFLRVRNFNVREAAEVFIKYLKVRELHPHCYKSLDVRDPGVLDLMSRGYMFPLYERDKQGRMVIFCKGSTFNQKHGHKPTDLFRSIIMTFETLLDDQDNQSNGFTYIFDQSGVCLSEVTFLGVFELQKLARSGEVSNTL